MSGTNYKRHWSGTRSGFNTRGGTPAEHLAIQRQVRAEEDSAEWERRFIEACEILEGLITPEATDAWIEETWPGATIERYTWKQLHDSVQTKIDQVVIEFERINNLFNAMVEIDVEVVR